MEEMRQAILEGRFKQYRAEFHGNFTPPDEVVRHVQRQKWLKSQGRPGV
jgi:predicted lipase